MARTPEKIVAEIVALANELAALKGSTHKAHKTVTRTTPLKGVAGAQAALMEEGFFNKPKELQAVLNRLKEMGHYHAKSSVAMSLLNMTKRRVLNRFKNGETGNWEYVIRK